MRVFSRVSHEEIIYYIKQDFGCDLQDSVHTWCCDRDRKFRLGPAAGHKPVHYREGFRFFLSVDGGDGPLFHDLALLYAASDRVQRGSDGTAGSDL